MVMESHLSVPEIWNVPLYNDDFTGREKELEQLQNRLNSGSVERSLKVAVAGLPGIGKSQTVKKLAHVLKHRYRLVWWINAETQLEQDYLRLAQKLSIPIDGRSFKDVVADVKERLRHYRDWMLIFDNVENPAVVTDLFPDQHTGTRGHIVVSVRDVKYWSDAFQIGPLQPKDAVIYLLKVTGQTDRKGAEQLAQRLGHFPLALSHAAGYIFAHDKTFEEYLSDYDRNYPELVQYQETWDNSNYTDYYRKTVRATFGMLFSQIKTNLASLDLLYFCSFLSPDNIPKFFIQSFLDSRKHQFDLAMAIIIKYAIIQRDKVFSATGESGYTYKDSYSLHRLVQEFISEQIPEVTKPQWLQFCVEMAERNFTPVQTNVVLWQHANDLISHIDIILNWVDKYHLQHPSVRQVTSEALEYCLTRDLLDMAEKSFARLSKYINAADLRNNAEFIVYAKFLITSISLLIAKRGKAGDYQPVVESIEHLLLSERWQEIANKTLYEELKYYLGVAFYEQQRHLDRSEQLQKEALVYFVEIDDEKRQLNSLCNLGALNQVSKHFSAAMQYFHYALILHQRSGYIYPNMGYVHNAMGAIYKDVNYPGKDIERAKQHYNESIKECERFPTISRTARFAGWAHYSLGLIYSDEGNYALALEHSLKFIEFINSFIKVWPVSYIDCLNVLSEKLVRLGPDFSKWDHTITDNQKSHYQFETMQMDVLQLKLNHIKKLASERHLDTEEKKELDSLNKKVPEVSYRLQRWQNQLNQQTDDKVALPTVQSTALPAPVDQSQRVLTKSLPIMQTYFKDLLQPLQSLAHMVDKFLPEKKDLLEIMIKEISCTLVTTNMIPQEYPRLLLFVVSQLEAMHFYFKFKYGEGADASFLDPLVARGNEIISQFNHCPSEVKTPNFAHEQKYFGEQTQLTSNKQFELLLHAITSEFMQENPNQRPSKNIFISYAWPVDDRHNESWTKLFVWRLALHLIQAGQKVYLDQIQSGGGMELHAFMNKKIREAHHVLVICDRTMKYKFEEDGFTGACFEYFDYIERHRRERSQRFIIPVCLNEEGNVPGLVKKFAEVSIYKDGYIDGLRSLIKLTYGFGIEFDRWWKRKLIELKLSDASLCESFGLHATVSQARNTVVLDPPAEKTLVHQNLSM